MEDNEKLINLLEKDPELYKIINSKEIMLLLEEIRKNPQKKDELIRKIYFKKVSILYNILDNLTKKNLIKKINIDNEEIYYITEDGDSFLRLCNKARNMFNI